MAKEHCLSGRAPPHSPHGEAWYLGRDWRGDCRGAAADRGAYAICALP